MGNLIENDFQKRLLLIKKLSCDELFFMQSDELKADVWEEVEIEIELKECPDWPENNS